jgi:hypothetical protein
MTPVVLALAICATDYRMLPEEIVAPAGSYFMLPAGEPARPDRPSVAPKRPTAPPATPRAGYPVHNTDAPGVFHIMRSRETRGELIDHLANDGVHRGKFDRAWLETLSRPELLSLHDADHRNFVRWDYVRGSGRAPAASSSRQTRKERRGVLRMLFGGAG